MIWICNKCSSATTAQPLCKNATCGACKSGRYRVVKICYECGKEYRPDKYKQQTCSKQCGYKVRFRNGNPKKGRKYPHLQKARIGNCIACGKEYRATWESKNSRKQKYCSHYCYVVSKPESIYEKSVRQFLEWQGIDFIQQHKIDKYSVDFYLPQTNTAVEVDGYYHTLEKIKASDARKNARLNELGVRVVRIGRHTAKILNEEATIKWLMNKI